MTAVPNRSTFESAYAGQAPWDIGKPQKAFINVADQITGSILDAGCGTGENALFFAKRGRKVTGIDFLAEPINRAKQKATERGLSATFLVLDALTLKDWSERFDNVIDSGLFHVFSDDDRRRYVEGLATVVKPGGRLFLLCFSDEEPGAQGPRRVSRKEIEVVFAEGWKVVSISAKNDPTKAIRWSGIVSRLFSRSWLLARSPAWGHGLLWAKRRWASGTVAVRSCPGDRIKLA